MIVDTIRNLREYFPLIPELREVADFLECAGTEKLSPGHYDIEGSAGKAAILEYRPEDKKRPRFETHDRCMEVQFMLRGRELHYHALREKLEPIGGYEEERDRTLYACPPEHTAVLMEKGSFAVYFPEDGHLTAVRVPGETLCRRLVVKLPVKK